MRQGQSKAEKGLEGREPFSISANGDLPIASQFSSPYSLLCPTISVTMPAKMLFLRGATSLADAQNMFVGFPRATQQEPSVRLPPQTQQRYSRHDIPPSWLASGSIQNCEIFTPVRLAPTAASNVCNSSNWRTQRVE